MSKNYLSPRLDVVVFCSEDLVLCASKEDSAGASANDFFKDDLTGEDFWN